MNISNLRFMVLNNLDDGGRDFDVAIGGHIVDETPIDGQLDNEDLRALMAELEVIF